MKNQLAEVVIAQRPFPETYALIARHARVSANSGYDAWTPVQLTEAAKNADALMAFMTDRIEAELLDACPNLAVVAGALKGHDNIDVEACTRRGVWVSTVPDLLTVPTAELTIGLMIGLARHIRAGDDFVRRGCFSGWSSRFYGTGLAGTTVGIIGMGAIGQAIATRLFAFGCNLVYSDPRDVRVRNTENTRLRHLSLSEVLESSQFLVMAAPLTECTLHLLNAHTLSAVRPGALLVNPCRGSVVDESAVLEALRSDRLGGYAADVFEMEDLSRTEDRPQRIDPSLLNHPRTLFTPHLGSAVTEIRQAIEQRAAENILAVLAGDRPKDAINTPRRL